MTSEASVHKPLDGRSSMTTRYTPSIGLRRLFLLVKWAWLRAIGRDARPPEEQNAGVFSAGERASCPPDRATRRAGEPSCTSRGACPPGAERLRYPVPDGHLRGWEAAMSEKKLSILAVGAHIGDAEITAGLLVTKYAAAGHRATILHMTAGEKGNPRMDHREYRRQRVTEAQAAAAEMGAAECIVLDHPDGELHAD